MLQRFHLTANCFDPYLDRIKLDIALVQYRVSVSHRWRRTFCRSSTAASECLLYSLRYAPLGPVVREWVKFNQWLDET